MSPSARLDRTGEEEGSLCRFCDYVRRLKIVIPGGSGQKGSILARAFGRDGHEVVVLSRSSRGDDADGVRQAPRGGGTVGEGAAELDGGRGAVNLAGRSVNCRHNP